MQQKAFTLIELLVVVLIIGILAAVAVPQYQVAVAKSRFTSMKIMAINISRAAQRFHLANNTLPSQYDELDINVPGVATSVRATFNNITCTLGKYEEMIFHVTCSLPASSGEVSFRSHYNVSKNRISNTCVTGINNELGKKICASETGKQEGDLTTDGLVLSYDY